MKPSKIILRIVACIAILSLAAGDSRAALPADSLVRIGRLNNGLSYYIRKNANPKGRVLLCLANKIGSIVESDEERGLAHFLEHMSFDGTKHYPANELIGYLQSNGVRFGADLNASTGFDETIYQLPIPSDNPQTLINGFTILHDWAQDLTLGDAEINKERNVVLEEIRESNNANQRMQQVFFPVLLNNSLYSRRFPLGQEEIIRHFTPAALRSFYKEWYRPDLQAIIVVGDIDVDSIEYLIKKGFSDLKNPKDPSPRIEYKIPLDNKDRFIVVADKEFPITLTQVIIKLPGLVIKTPSDLRTKMIRSLYNQIMQERFSAIGSQSDPPFAGAGSKIDPFIGGIDALSTNVISRPGEFEKGFKALWTEIWRVQKYGFTQPEIDRAKQNYLARLESAYMARDRTASDVYARAYQDQFLKGEVSMEIADEYNFCKSALADLSPQDLNTWIESSFRGANRDIIILCPDSDKASEPDEATLLSWIKETEASPVAMYTDTVQEKSLLPILPSPGRIIKEKRVPAIDVSELLLSNGVKVILKHTGFSNNEVLFSAFAPGGTSLYGDKDFQSASDASLLVKSSGIGALNPAELAKYLSGKNVSVTPYISERTEGFTGYSSVADLPAALQLIYLYFTEPRMDPLVCNGIISRTKTNLANRGNDPNAVFSDTVAAILGNYNIRRTGPSIEKADLVNPGKAFSIFKDRFSNAGNFTFLFVGGFDTTGIRQLAEQYLGSLPSYSTIEAAKDPGISIPRGKISKIVNKGREDKSEALLIFSGDYAYSPEENNQLIGLADVLKIKLTERLRGDLGGVYAVSTSAFYVKYPKETYSLTISFQCGSGSLDTLISICMEEIGKMRSEGPRSTDVDKFRAEKTHLTEVQLTENSFWLHYLDNKYQNNEDPGKVFAYAEKLEKITSASLKLTAIKYLNDKNCIRFELLPEITPPYPGLPVLLPAAAGAK